MHPDFAAVRALLIVFAEPSASTEPRQGALHNPPARQHLKAVDIRFPAYHGQQPSTSGPRPRHQLTSVASIGPDRPQSGKPTQQFGQHPPGAVPILDTGGMNHRGQQQSYGVHYNVPLASGNPFTRVIAARPPFSVVFTDWLSMMAALVSRAERKHATGVSTVSHHISGTRSRRPSGPISRRH